VELSHDAFNSRVQRTDAPKIISGIVISYGSVDELGMLGNCRASFPGYTKRVDERDFDISDTAVMSSVRSGSQLTPGT